MPNIIDIIIHTPKAKYYGNQIFLVLDEMPSFKYERIGQWLHAEDSGFFSQYKYDRPGPNWKAFAGRKFDIPMKDGTTEHAYGQWWDAINTELIGVETCSPGIKTLEKLEECYVFVGGIAVKKSIVEDWLEENKHSTDYSKYDPRKRIFLKPTTF